MQRHDNRLIKTPRKHPIPPILGRLLRHFPLNPPIINLLPHGRHANLGQTRLSYLAIPSVKVLLIAKLYQGVEFAYPLCLFGGGAVWGDVV